jgi:hypothetical protein
MDLTKVLVEQGGLWGVIAVGLASALLYQERQRQAAEQRCQTERRELQAKLDQEHAARLSDARALLDIAEQTHEALAKLESFAPRR